MSLRREPPQASVPRNSRPVLRVGLAACLAVAVSLGGGAIASASPAPSHDGRGGAPGGGGFFGGAGPYSRQGRGAIVGTVATAPGATAPTTFTMNVAGTGSTTTLVTVDVSTTTTLSEPGTSSPSLSGILAADQVEVWGTQGGTNTVGATSVTVVPVSSGYGGHGGHGRGGHGRR